MSAPRFTVFTPTYNRAHTLPRVYASLRAQTFRDFEWLVVDDGSSDGTRDLVARWAAEAPFPIHYQYQPNAGKAAATNEGVRRAAGELFLIADSDDEFVADALERLNLHWESIPATERDRFTGVTGLCCDEQGRLVGETFPTSPFDSDSLELYWRYGVRSEKWGFHRTDVLRQFPFPTADGTKHTPEDVVWHAIARKYRTRFVNDVLRIYHQDGGGQLTRMPPLAWARFRGYYARQLYEERDWMLVAPFAFFRLLANYVRWCFVAGDPLSLHLERLRPATMRVLWALAVAPGWLLAARDRWRDRAASRRAGPRQEEVPLR